VNFIIGKGKELLLKVAEAIRNLSTRAKSNTNTSSSGKKRSAKHK
jgi:hypothetical protein